MKIAPHEVHETLGRSILVEGYPFVLDIERSHGQWLRDARGARDYLDFFTFYASRAVAFDHPKMRSPELLERLLLASRTKPSNGDIYTDLYAEFVETFRTHALGPGMRHLFFVDGGALAVENALKAAFDWKARKNLESGRPTKDLKVIHFTHAFHGRSGYTLSLTNTHDPRKTQYFPKFEWPRVTSPYGEFPLEGPNLDRLIETERKALYEIDEAYARHGADAIACILIEPIQGEGGDRHMRPEFLRSLRKICDARETILAFDEVQTGMGATGTMWFYEQCDVRPDVAAFAKKAQTGGIMASDRFDEVESVFEVKSRISSTFGGNLVDFVRCQRILEILREDELLANVRVQGAYLLERMKGIAAHNAGATSPRGRGTLAAIDLPDSATRDRVIDAAAEEGLLVLPSGERSVRLRTALDLGREDAEVGMDMLEAAVERVLAG